MNFKTTLMQFNDLISFQIIANYEYKSVFKYQKRLLLESID